MTTSPLATYSFLPWLRQGLATRIDGATGERARLNVTIELVGHTLAGDQEIVEVERAVALYGPGDIVGIESRAIVRTEPLPAIANFEPNYLPFVEFYDEDFPWRYTPDKPTGRKLTPWLTLVVLREGEFKTPRQGSGPLPCIDVADASLLPPPADLWAWAHVHVHSEIIEGAPLYNDDPAQVSEALRMAIASNPDEACSRLMCARRLAPNEGYDAFLIPTFESGRLAGLGRDPAATPAATHVAWVDHPGRADLSPTLYPFYHRWNFRTGASGDFEY
jgi:hypothetical protein